MFKKFLLFFIITCGVIIAPQIVNAQVTSTTYYSSQFDNIFQSSSACPDSFTYNAKYIRWSFNDLLASNHTYSIDLCITLHSYDDYAWFQWTGNSGINAGGSYISTSPSSANTVSQQILQNGNYAKRSCFTFNVQGNGSSSNFFQVAITDENVGINRACMNVFNVIDTTQQSNNSDIINNANQNTSNIIDSQNSNTQNIINNQNSNTQTIINNNNSNTQQQIESQRVCNFVDKSSIIKDNSYLDSNGVLNNSNSFGVTDFISINGGKIENLVTYDTNYSVYTCFYNVNKELISCVKSNLLTDSFPINSSFVRVSIFKFENKPQFYICKNGNQALNDSLTDSNVDISSQIIDAPTTSHPISSLVTAPISFLQSLDDTCTPISFTLGFTGTSTRTIILPCGDTIFWNRNDLNYVQEFRLFWNVLFGGALLYFFGMKLFKTFEKALDPFETGINDLEV